MRDVFETSGNKHWWPRDKKSRKAAFRVLSALNRVITPALVNAALPPLPPKLWSKMRRKRPDLYADELAKVKVGLPRLTKKEWEAFVKACGKWKVNRADVVTAFMALFVKLVESQDKE